MLRPFSRLFHTVALAALLAAGGVGSARAGSVQLWGYLGYNFTNNSDVTFRPFAGAPTVTYPNVAWDGASFKAPWYYGVRGTYWLDAYPGFGVGVDYSHAKVVAQRPAALDALVQHFEYTDGLNIVTFDGMYRWRLGERWSPYVGAGVGFTVPSVEVTLRPPLTPTRTHQYEFGGPAVQGKVGLQYALYGNVAVFGEYKLAYSSVDVTIRNGGREQEDLLTHQFIVGLSYTFDTGH